MLLNCKSFLTYIISCSAFGFHCSGRWMKSKADLPKLMLFGPCHVEMLWNVKCCQEERGFLLVYLHNAHCRHCVGIFFTNWLWLRLVPGEAWRRGSKLTEKLISVTLKYSHDLTRTKTENSDFCWYVSILFNK